MESVLCSGHKKECYLKTGGKPGPNFKRSFYVCSVRESRCDFVQPVSVTPRNCDKHPSAIVELQAICRKDGENRCYFRCHQKKEGTDWCGFKIRKALQGNEKPVKSNKEAKPSSKHEITKELAKGEKKELPSFSSLSNSEHKAPLFGKQDKLEDIKPVKDGNDSFTQWRDSPVKDTSRQKEKANLTSALQKQKELLSRVQLSALPDKGARLKENIQHLESKIQNIDLNKDVSRSSKTHNEPEIIRVHPPNEPGGQPIHKTVKKPTHNEPEIIRVHPPNEPGGQPIHKTVKKPSQQEEVDSDDEDGPLSASNYSENSQIHKHHDPKNLRQTKLTEAFALPKEFLEGSYSQASWQPVALYGGRMTVKRLEEVRNAMDKITNSLHEQLKTCPKEDEEEEDPRGLRVSLMPHQKHALAWLLWRQKQNPSGGILADDMGLGKTLTMISFIMKQKQEDSSLEKKEEEEWLKKDSRHVMKSKSTLIITPASLVHQWGKEVEARCKRGSLDVLIYHGPNRERNINVITSKDIVLTTYKVVSLEIGRKEDTAIADRSLTEEEENEVENEAVCQGKLPLLLQIHWKNVILDEAHDIRNYKSLTATSVTRLKASSRWMLTGTPIQNKLLDMYSLLRFLRFRPFDEYKVWKNQVESNERTGKTRLNIIVQSLLLRRTKDQTVNGKPLIKMTKKKLSNYKLTLSPEEQKLYSKIFKRIQSVVQAYIRSHMDKDSLLAGNSSSYENHHPKHNTASQSGSTATKKPTGKDVLVFLLRLRQCCCHLSLLRESLDKEMTEEIGLDLSLTEQLNDLTLQENDLKGYLDEDSKNENNSQQDVKQKDRDIFRLECQSTKIKALLEMLQAIYKNAEDRIKCVVVSQWTKLLMIVKYHITQAHFTYHLIDGAVPPKKRSEIVDDFNTNPNGAKILLLSLKAGGVGLNLIGGRHLFLLDNHWNPALEEQASDRIYRVGQKHDVEIHRFVCLNTIEEKILTLQSQKRKLAKDVLTTSGQSNSRLQLNDLRMLFEIK
ncbi:transcription termination factor 2 isoform X2 [Octopus sinensis]|uniref:Transcription termination factor 2 n=1 Tax=Octopus sinensis TaxID=2607531 RepID=A0A7E6F896_9MOLL|nr:transcription termination factor 2 isoform X2 [Octopus sinensis]